MLICVIQGKYAEFDIYSTYITVFQHLMGVFILIDNFIFLQSHKYPFMKPGSIVFYDQENSPMWWKVHRHDFRQEFLDDFRHDFWSDFRHNFRLDFWYDFRQEFRHMSTHIPIYVKLFNYNKPAYAWKKLNISHCNNNIPLCIIRKMSCRTVECWTLIWIS